MSEKKITFGVINCNRLHYLKSCLWSFEKCNRSHPLYVKIVIVDNASTEPGTEGFLKDISDDLGAFGYNDVKL